MVLKLFTQRERRGFTLIEILVAMVVFVTAVVLLLGIYVGIAALRETSRNLTQATTDARAVLEAMRDESEGGLNAVTAVDWTDWAEQNNLTSLAGETITVEYEDPAADPLDITVRVDWQERSRERFTEISTLMTER